MLEEKIIGYAENGYYKITEDISNIVNGRFWAENVLCVNPCSTSIPKF